jgi:hypothetical protein
VAFPSHDSHGVVFGFDKLLVPTFRVEEAIRQGDKEPMDKELKQYLDAMKAELKSDIERVKQAVLTESDKRGSPAELRAQTHQAVLRVMDMEMQVPRQRMEKR